MNEIERYIAKHLIEYGLKAIKDLEYYGGELARGSSKAIQSGNKSEYDLYVNAFWEIRSKIKAIEWMYDPENGKFCRLVSKIANELI